MHTNTVESHFRADAQGMLRFSKIVVLSMLPMAGALLGASWDEHQRSGYSVWRSACRASGLSLSSVITFTLELLPSAIIGSLIGSLVVLATAPCRGRDRVRDSLAAHAGCVLAMPAALVLCALAWPLPLMLAVESIVAGTAALLILPLLRTWQRRAAPGIAAR